MTRAEKTALLIRDSMRRINEDISILDYEFLYAVISGDGWVPYNQLTDDQLDVEFNELENEDKETCADSNYCFFKPFCELCEEEGTK